MRMLRSEIGRVRWTVVLATVLLIALPAVFALAAYTAGHTGFTGVTIQPKAYMTNSFVVNNDSGTAQLTMTKAGVATWTGAQTYNGDATFNEDVSLCVASDDKVTFTAGYFTKFRVGTGDTPGITLGSDDVFIEGSTEVNGELQADGIFDANSTSDFADTATFSKGSGNAIVVSAGGKIELPATADISCDGYVNIGDGNPNGAVTAGNDEELYVEGEFECDGTAEFDGNAEFDGTVDMDSTLDVAGTLTASKGSGNAISVSAGGNLALAATADLMAAGYVAVGDGTPNGDVTAGTDEEFYCEGDAEFDGALNADGTFNCDGSADFAADVTFAGTSSVVEMNGAWKFDSIDTKTSAYNASAATFDGILLMNTSSGAFTYTIPDEDCDATADVGRIIVVKCIGSCGGKPLTIDPEGGGQTVDGAATATIATNYGSLNLLCGAADTWYIF